MLALMAQLYSLIPVGVYCPDCYGLKPDLLTSNAVWFNRNFNMLLVLLPLGFYERVMKICVLLSKIINLLCEF